MTTAGHEPLGRHGPSAYDEARRLAWLAGQERSPRRRDRLFREAGTYALLALVEIDRVPGAATAGAPVTGTAAGPDRQPDAPATGASKAFPAIQGDSLYFAVPQAVGDPTLWSNLVVHFYDLILGHPDYPEQADPLLAPYFAGIDRARLERHFLAFLIQATGGPRQYSGRAMRAAHARVNARAPITDEAWDRVIGHLAAALRSYQVPEEYVGQLAAAVQPLRAEIVTASG